MALEIEEQKLLELTEALEFLQLHSKVCIDKVSGEEGRKKCMQGPIQWGRRRSIGILVSFVALLSCLGFFPFGLPSLASYLM